MEHTLLSILNSYSKEYKNGNEAVLPAICRIIAKLEDMGYEVKVRNEHSYMIHRKEN